VTAARPLRAVIVDDEPPALALLREYLAEIGGVEVVAECGNGFEAVAAVTRHDPDILLLDIQMPQLSGFEVLEALDREIATVFITAYDEHAVRAFEVHAVDYLLKPFSAQRLRLAIARARERSGRAAPAPSSAALAAAARPPGAMLERIVVRDGAAVAVVPVASLDWVEAADDYVVLHAAGRTYRKQQTLGELESQLDPGRFVRAHRSIILSVARVSSFELYAKDSRVAVLADGTKLPVSRSGYARLRQRLG
jgi:two-component system LytT family response regulator